MFGVPQIRISLFLLPLETVPTQCAGAGCSSISWLPDWGETGSQTKDLGELSMLLPSVVEAKWMVGSLAPWPWLLLKPFLFCPALPIFQ